MEVEEIKFFSLNFNYVLSECAPSRRQEDDWNDDDDAVGRANALLAKMLKSEVCKIVNLCNVH